MRTLTVYREEEGGRIQPYWYGNEPLPGGVFPNPGTTRGAIISADVGTAADCDALIRDLQLLKGMLPEPAEPRCVGCGRPLSLMEATCRGRPAGPGDAVRCLACDHEDYLSTPGGM